MTVLNVKLRRDIFAAKARLAGIVVIIAIGVTIFVCFLSLYFNMELSRRSYYAQCRLADFWVRVERLPVTELNRLQKISGISELRGRISQHLTIDLPNVKQPLSGTLVSLPADPKPVINNIVMRRGSYFTGLRRDEVIVNDAFARKRGLKPGDHLYVLLNDRRHEVVVIGTAISAEFAFTLAPGSIVPDIGSYGVLYVTHEFAEDIMNLNGATNEIVGLLTPEFRQYSQVVLRQLEQQIRRHGEPTTTPRSQQLSHSQIDTAIQQLQALSLIAPPIFLGAAALILDVLMKRIAEQQRTTVGTLKAIGRGNHELVWHFMKFGIVVGVVGGVLGALLGYWLAGVLLDLYEQFIEMSRMVNRPYPWLIATSILLSVLFAVIGTIRGVVAIMRLNPSEAMRPKPPASARQSLLEQWRWLWTKLGFRWKMVLRGLVRHPTRVITGIFCALVGTTLIVMALAVNDATDELVYFTFDKMMVSDFDLAFQSELEFGAFLEARRLPGVEYAEPLLNLPCAIHHQHRSKDTAVIGIVPTARLTVLRDFEGQRVVLPDHGLVFTEQLADMLSVTSGDVVSVVFKKGERRRIQVPVVMVIQSYTGASAYAQFDYLNRLIGEVSSVNRVQVEFDPSKLDSFYGAIKTLPKLQGFSALHEQRAFLQALVKQNKASNQVQILFAGLLFAGSVITASLVSLAERRQEIATFRVLGYREREIGTIFFLECMILNGAGILIGLPTGYYLGKWVVDVSATEQMQLPYLVTNKSWFIAIGLGVIFTALANYPVHRAIKTMDWMNALNVQE